MADFSKQQLYSIREFAEEKSSLYEYFLSKNGWKEDKPMEDVWKYWLSIADVADEKYKEMEK